MDQDLNLSGSRLLINSFSVVEFRPRFKMVVPRGIDVKFDGPSSSMYHNRIYTDVKRTHIPIPDQEDMLRYKSFKISDL